MKTKRLLLVASLLAGIMCSGASLAGQLKVQLDADRVGGSNGYFQYLMVWSITGDGATNYSHTALDKSEDNHGPFTRWHQVFTRNGWVHPVPLDYYHRVRVCKGLLSCPFSFVKSNIVWVPKVKCGNEDLE